MAGQLVHCAMDSKLGASNDTFSAFGNRTNGANYAKTVAPAAGTAGSLYVEVSAVPGTGNSRTLTLWVNGGSTSMTVTISGTDVNGTYTGTAVSVSAGDRLDFRHTYSGAPASAVVRWSWVWTPTTTDYTFLASTIDSTQLSTGMKYFPLAGCLSGPTTGFHDLYLPTAGTIRNLYVRLSTAPGVGRKNRRFVLMKNGVASSLVCTISDLNKTGNDTSNTVSVADGDYISIRATEVGGLLEPNGFSTYVTIGVVFEPDESDLFLIPYSSPTYLPIGSVTRYSHICSAGDSWTISSYRSPIQQMTVRRFRGHKNYSLPVGTYWYFSSYGGAPDITLIYTTNDAVETNYRHLDDWATTGYRKVQSSGVPNSIPYNQTSCSLCLSCVLGHVQTEREHTSGHLGINI